MKKSFLAVLLALAAAAIIAAQSPGDDAMLQADFPVLYKRAGAQQAADYVIVIDKSLSMKRFWAPVKQALSAFVSAVPDGDYLSIVVFGVDGGLLTTPTPMNAETRETVRQAVERLQEPKDLNTDLGKAFERCLDELNRPGGNVLKFVFFLTDFNHDPTPGSPYARSTNPQDAVWQRLAERRRNEGQGKIDEVSALLLPLEAEVGRNLSLGKAIFPNLQEERVNQETLGTWFERRRAEIARDKLRARVRDDMRKPPLVIEKVEADLPLFSTSGRLVAWVRPADARLVDVVRLRSLESKMNLDEPLPTEVEIDPVTEQEIAMSAAGEAWPITVAEIKGGSFFRSSLQRKIHVVIEGMQEGAPTEELHKLNLADSMPFQVAASFDVEVPYGRVPIIYIIGLGVLAFGLVAARVYHCRPEYLFGEVTVLGVKNRSLRKSEKKTEFQVGNIQAGEGIQVPGATWRLTIRAFTPCGKTGRPRGVYARMESGSATLKAGPKNQSLGTDWKELPRGSTVEVAGKKVIWN